MKGTNYVATKTMEVKDLVIDNYPTIKTLATETFTEGTQYVEKNWDQIYSTTMYIPKKAIQVTGSVYINAQEIVFAYTKVCNFVFIYTVFTPNFELRGHTLNHSIWSVQLWTIYVINNK